MEIAAFEGNRDDNHAMTPPLKVEQMLVSRAATGPKARQRVLGVHDIRVAFFHAPAEEDVHVRMTSGVSKLVNAASFVRYTTGELAVAERSRSRPEGA